MRYRALNEYVGIFTFSILLCQRCTISKTICKCPLFIKLNKNLPYLDSRYRWHQRIKEEKVIVSYKVRKPEYLNYSNYTIVNYGL